MPTRRGVLCFWMGIKGVDMEAVTWAVNWYTGILLLAIKFQETARKQGSARE